MKWIKVSEELPDGGDSHLLMVKHKHSDSERIMEGYRRGDNWYTQDEFQINTDQQCVIMWTYLPRLCGSEV